jgi:5'-nucleotidase
MHRSLLRAALAIVLSLALVAPSPEPSRAASVPDAAAARQSGGKGAGATIGLQLLVLNDFHGGLLPGRVGDRPAGGAAVLASYMDAAEAEARAQGAETLRLSAGDNIGASPPISALLQDEPTMDALDMLGIRYSVVGNHEFDEGLAELRRLQDGGCHSATGCYAGARMRYLAANVVDEGGAPIFPPYAIEYAQGVPVGLIGVVLRDTPTIVIPSGVAGLRFLDEADTIDRYVAELKGRGVETIVALVHQGGNVAPGGSPNGGPLTGPIVTIAERTSQDVDVILSGHTHQGYQATVAGKLVTQAFANGTAYADVDLLIDTTTKDVVAKQARIVTAYADAGPGLTPNADLARFVGAAEQRVAPIVGRVVGQSAAPITREQAPSGEQALGNLIADAQRRKMGAQMAAMNPGGIRADLPAGQLTYGTLYAVQPFGNDLVKMTLTGEQLYALFNQQWSQQADGTERYRPLQVSGIRVTWEGARPAGDRIVALELPDGTPIDRAASYTIVVNSFMADGGDGFVVLREGRDRVVGPVDLDALVEYVEGFGGPVTATQEGRIVAR